MIKDSDKIKYIGVLDDHAIISLYKKAGCIVSPSTKEGLGLSYIEAKEQGCKIISTDFSPMNEYSDYNCKSKIVKDNTLQPLAFVSAKEILGNIIKYYEDYCV